MALAIDAISSRRATEAGTTATFAHTCTGSNGVLVVTSKNGNNRTITDVTYNGVAMTQAVVAYNTTDNIHCYIYTLANPSTGTHDIVITFSSTGAEHGSGGVSFTGSQTSSPVGAVASNTGSGTGPSKDITTLYDNSIVIDVVGNNVTGGGDPTAGAGQTKRWSFDTIDSGQVACTTEPTTTAGTVTMSETMASSNQWAHAIAEIREYIGSPSASMSPSASLSPSSSASRSQSPSASLSPSSSTSLSQSPSSSASASRSPSSSASASQSPSASLSPSSSTSPSASRSPSSSASASLSSSASLSPSSSSSSSSSASRSPSSSASNSLSPSSSVSPSPSPPDWDNQAMNSASWSVQSQNTATFNNQDKNDASWTNQNITLS